MGLRISAASWCGLFAAALGLGGQSGCGSTSDDGAPGGGPSLFKCENGVPWSENGGPSGGAERCDSGMIHRPAVGQCTGGPPWPTGGVPDPYPLSFGTIAFGDGCRKDSECVAMPHGYCQFIGRSGPELSESNCTYACASDADCDAGFVCSCGETVGTCVPAECATDADCNGKPCILLPSVAICGQPAHPRYACGRADQQCATDAHCAGSGRCIAGECESGFNVCGRPFLVGGVERQATAVSRSDWLRAVTLDMAGLAASRRATLAAHYTRAGLMEHASIAAFARFIMDLLALGAPPSLVMDAQGALADELDHALVCFGLASAYAGAECGPGAIDVADAMQRSDDGDILDTVFREMCIGETRAAMEVAESALRATEPTVRAALERIAEDETRHATLGWKFVKWLLDKQSVTERERSVARLRAMVAEERRPQRLAQTSGVRQDDLEAHGYLDDAVRSAVHATAIAEVVAPCLQALARRQESSASASV